MVMAGLYTGAVASEERWQTRRSEARAAFMEFMKMNPQATYDDYRSFVNDITEGNSFLRGGIPSDKVLNRLAETKAQEYANEQMRQRIQILSGQAQLAGQLDALAGNYALDIEDDDKLTETVAGAIGYDAKNPATHSILDMVRRQHPNGYGTIRNNLRQELFDKNLPTIEKIIAANPNLQDDEVIQLIPGLSGQAGTGPRKRLVSELVGAARANAQKAAEKASLERISTAVEDARKQIDATGAYSLPSLGEGENVEAERQIKPYFDAFKQRDQETKKQAAKTAMADAAKLYTSTPGFTQALIASPERQAMFKEHLRRAAQTAGYEADDNDVNFILQSALTAGNFATSEKDAQSLKDYRTQLADAVKEDGMQVDMLPLPPTFGTPDNQSLAADEFRQATRLLLERRQKANADASGAAVVKVRDNLLADEALIDQLARGDISAERLDTLLAGRLATELNRTPEPHEIAAIKRELGVKIDTINSSKLVAETTKTEEKTRAEIEGDGKVGQQALLGLILQNAGSDGEETPETAVLRTLVESQIFGPSSGLSATPDAVRVLAPLMTKEFVEEHDGDLNAMYNAIFASPVGEQLRQLGRKQNEDLVSAGFPYGNRRGSKTAIVKTVPELVVQRLDTVDQTLNSAYMALSEFAKRDDPSTTVDGQRPVDEFNGAILKAKQEAQQAVAAAIRQMEAAASKSKDWSTDGPITPEEITQARQLLAARLRQTLRTIDEIGQKGGNLVLSLGNRAEDEVMGTSERLQEQGAAQPRPPLGERVRNSPGGQFIRGLIDSWPDPVY